MGLRFLLKLLLKILNVILLVRVFVYLNEFVPNYVRDEKLADMTLADLDDRTPEQKKQEENSEDEIYSIKNFSI